MEQWWTSGQLFVMHDYILGRLTEEGDRIVAERVMALAEHGLLEIGERDGRMTVRLATCPAH
jgi:hypothetical protein